MRARGCCWALRSFQVAAGDKIGLVGRNGAGKTTLARVLAGEAQPAAGTVRRNGSVGYLPQDTRAGDLDALAMDRVLSARGLDELMAGHAGGRGADGRRPTRPGGTPPCAGTASWRNGYRARRVRRRGRGRVDRRQPRPAGPGARQPLRTLSGGQRRRVELARILFGGAQTLLLDEPTNHLDADSVAWLREHLGRSAAGSW